MRIIVTGGAGFIGSNLVRFLLKNENHYVLTMDKLTYAGNQSNLFDILNNERHSFLKLDICDKANVSKAIQDFKPDLIFHLAAESHVDRSIDCAHNFIQTNIVGTYNLLECCLNYWVRLPQILKENFKFIHISTDEVFGEVRGNEKFSENSSYLPNSPYAASKASGDLLVRSYYKTFSFPMIISNCSNNYGPNQYPEKLIPVCILNAIHQKKIPIYGNGHQVRDWIHVFDHIAALWEIAKKGKIGETYCIGANSEYRNIDIATKICLVLDKLKPMERSYCELIEYVTDRLGHDKRYAIDNTKLKLNFHWQPKIDFESGLEHTVHWYLENEIWWRNILNENNDVLMRIGTRNLKSTEESLV